MSQEQAGQVRCLSCGKKYAWQQRHAGERLKCKTCGGEIIMPYLAPDPPRDPIPMSGLPPVAGRSPGTAEAPKIDEPTDSLLGDNDDEPEAAAAPPDEAPTIPAPAPEEAPPLDMGQDPPADQSREAVEEYELDIEPEEMVTLDPTPDATAAPGKCQNCGTNLKPGAVICLNCGFNHKEGKKISTAVGAAADDAADSGQSVDPGAQALLTRLSAVPDEKHEYESDSAFTEVYAPIIMVVSGLLLVLLDAFVIFDASLHADTFNTTISPRVVILIKHGIDIAVQLPCLVAGIFLIGMLFGTSFSSLPSAIMKFVGLALFLSGFGGCLYSVIDRITEGEGWMGYMMMSCVNLGIFWGMSMWLFDLDHVEVMLLWAVSILLPIFLAYFVMTMLIP